MKKLLKTRKFYPIFIITLITSSVIEYSQLKIGRTFDIDDIILNLVGGIIGYFIFLIYDVFESHMPAFVKSETFKNILMIIIIIVLIFIYSNFSLWGILK